MDLDGFLEKDMITYLENAINFDTKERQEMQSELDALLAEKDSPESSSLLTQAKQKTDSAPEQTVQSTAATSETDADVTTTDTASQAADTAELTETSDSSETTETSQTSSTDATPVEIQAQEVTITTPDEPPEKDELDSAQETNSEQDTAWIDELDKQAENQRSELEKLIRLEDTLNDLQHAIMQQEADKAHALYTHLQQETESIQNHPTEKQFLMDALARLAKELSSLDDATEQSSIATPKESDETETTIDTSNEDALDASTELTSDTDTLTHPPSLAEESSTTYDEEEPVLSDAMQSVADQFLADAESEAETPPPFSIDPLDLPASFVQEETKAVVSYVEGVTALRNGDKTAALEIFLALAKKRPKNLAIKIRLQEAIELP